MWRYLMRSGLLGIAFMMMLFASGVFAASPKIGDLVPNEIDGWKADGEDGEYDRENLYDYIDGGAEVYLAYGYTSAFARRFTRAGQPAITADVFDMGSSEDAYGIFSFEREGKSVGVGQDSEYAAGFLRFWRGRYFVSILADKETPEAKGAVMSLGKAIADGIKDAGARPGMLAFLPQSTLIPASARFFHQKSGLDYHYLVADKNILNLGPKTNVLLAQFKTPVRGKPKVIPKAQLLLVQYPAAKDASLAYASFKKAYMPEAKASSIMKTEDGKWVAARLNKTYVAIVFEAPDSVYANSLLDSIISGMEAKPK
jgi:hypothetical protein